MGKSLESNGASDGDGMRFVPVTPRVLKILLRQKPSVSKLWYTLALHADLETGMCWPTYERIQNLSGLSRTSISTASKALQDLGLVGKRRRFSAPNRYSVKGLSLLGNTDPKQDSDSSEKRTTVVREIDRRSPDPETLTTSTTTEDVSPSSPLPLRDVAFRRAGRLAFEGRLGGGRFSDAATQAILTYISGIDQFRNLNLSGQARLEVIKTKLAEFDAGFALNPERTGRTAQHWFEGCFRRWLE